MKLFFKSKEGGPDSSVTGYWLIEWKRVFSIVLLKFDGRSREAYHTHAFNAFSFIIPFVSDSLIEWTIHETYGEQVHFLPRFFTTPRDRMHKISSWGVTWVLSFRGPWSDTWQEINEHGHQTLTRGRKVVS